MSVTLAYDELGPAGAPVLVLGNSIGTRRQLWDPVLERLAGRFRVVRYEHRGHGGSPAPAGPYTLGELGGDVLALLDALGLQRVHYAGVSLGGMVGMWLAAHAPDRVDRLALVCTSAHLPPAGGWRDRAARVRADGMASISDAVLPRWFTPEFAAAQAELVARARAMLESTDPQGYAGCCEAIAGMDLLPELGGIGAPTLVLAGAQDPATPPEHAERIAAAIPGARLALVEDAAHLAVLQQPAACAELLLAHLHAEPEETP